MRLKKVVGILAVSVAFLGCDVESERDYDEERMSFFSEDDDVLILQGDEAKDLLGNEAAAEAEAEAAIAEDEDAVSEDEDAASDDKAPKCECVLGDSYLRRQGHKCFWASCVYDAACPLFTGNWGPESEMPCPVEIL